MEARMKEQEIIVESLIHIEWHIDEGVDVRELSQALHYSPQRLSRMFHKVTGIYLSKYIRLRVLMEAKRRLSTYQSLYDIAKAFRLEPETLIRSFRKEFGNSLFSLEEFSYPQPLGKDLIKKMMITSDTEV